MALKMSQAAITASLSAILDLSAVGAGAGSLVIYSGTPPATAGTALAGNTALVTFALPGDPIWGSVTADSTKVFADMTAVTPVTASADGTATFFRLLNGDSDVIYQGTISLVGGGGDAELSAVDIITGIEVTVISHRFGQPFTA